ncbi:saccharopine dehydrogenase [Pilobolus umbonatus]|nr:saccharopine dehydrogenase [Pilobolus umbonatus]
MTDYHQRKYDLVLFGATGFTGELTCEYIAGLNDESLKWAIAGRNLIKLEKVRDHLITKFPNIRSLDCLIGDSTQPESLDTILSQTRVVISTVGPFIQYGTPLVEACIRNHTHYVDITGEYTWMKQIIQKHNTSAQQNHVMIVPACGFDSVPSDLGAYMVTQYIQTQHHVNVSQVKMSVSHLRGGVSSGTVLSMLEVLVDNKLKDQIDPYLLATKTGVDKAALPILYKDSDFDSWQAAFVMGAVNEKVVRRSWSIWTDRGKGYGSIFTYQETMGFNFFIGLVFTMLLYTVIPAFALLLRIPGVYEYIKQLVPKFIPGPSRDKLKSGGYEFQFIGYPEDEPYDEHVKVMGIVRGFGDPGYNDTCRMVTESALCILKHLDELPGKEGGILTPSTAFGHTLINRLSQGGGMVFEVKDL